MKKLFYSLFDYIYPIGILPRIIRATRHYHEEHEREVDWETVISIIFDTKSPRKKGDVFEIETDRYYILFSIKRSVIYVINAKKKR